MLGWIEHLSWVDIVTFCLPLAAAVLAVVKETRKEQQPGAGKKITPIGVAVLFLAFIGFAISLHSANDSKQEAKRKFDDENLFRSYIKAALDQELPGAIRNEIRGSQDEINRFVSEAVDASKRTLQDAMDQATRESSEKVTAKLSNAISSSGDEVTVKVADTIRAAGDEIARDVAVAVDTRVNESTEKIKGAVAGAVEGSKATIIDTTTRAIEAQATIISTKAEKAVATQVMQIPLVIQQDSPRRRLGGLLSDMFLKVEDVSKDRPFDVEIEGEDGQRIAGIKIPPAKRKDKKLHILFFTHPSTNLEYRVEITARTQRNLFGTGEDYIIARVVGPFDVSSGK